MNDAVLDQIKMAVDLQEWKYSITFSEFEEVPFPYTMELPLLCPQCQPSGLSGLYPVMPDRSLP